MDKLSSLARSPSLFCNGVFGRAKFRAWPWLATLVLPVLLGSCSGVTKAGGNAAPIAAVSVTPATATVAINGTAQFAALTNAAGAAVQWEVNQISGGNGIVGTVSAAGLYKAPPSIPNGAVTVTAVLQTDLTRVGS